MCTMTKQHKLMREKGSKTNCRSERTSLAEHVGGRMASGAIRELSRLRTRMATWISCVDGHVVLLVVARIVPFPDGWPPMLPISRCATNQPCVDMQEMNPYFVVATLVGMFDSKNFMRNFERTVHANMPLSFGTRWLDETAHIGPCSWNPAWLPHCCRAMWNWQVRVGKRLLISAVAPLFVT